MMRLKSKLLSLNAQKEVKVKVYSPRNCEELKIPFKAEKIAKVVGKLASSVLPPGASLPLSGDTPDAQASAPPQTLTGVLVQNDFKLSLMAAEDLREHAGLSTTAVVCRHHLALPYGSSVTMELVKWTLECSFGAVDELPEAKAQLAIDSAKADAKLDVNGDTQMSTDDVQNVEDQGPKLVAAWLIMGCIKLWCYSDGGITLEWEGNQIHDTLADAVISTLFTASTSPAAVKREYHTSLIFQIYLT